MNGSGLSDNFYLVTNYRREKRTISYSPVELIDENALFEKVISKVRHPYLCTVIFVSRFALCAACNSRQQRAHGDRQDFQMMTLLDRPSMLRTFQKQMN